MSTNTKDTIRGLQAGAMFVEQVGEEGWGYIKTIIGIVREPILLLGKDFRVIMANEPFYQAFQIEAKDAEGKIVYGLGNGQWNIPSLHRLLEDILPENKFFKGYEIAHNFPFIGPKAMMVNARQIYCKEDTTLAPCPPIILLAMEDVTEIMAVADTLAKHANQVEGALVARTQKLEFHIKKLEEEIDELKS